MPQRNRWFTVWKTLFSSIFLATHGETWNICAFRIAEELVFLPWEIQPSGSVPASWWLSNPSCFGTLVCARCEVSCLGSDHRTMEKGFHFSTLYFLFKCKKNKLGPTVVLDTLFSALLCPFYWIFGDNSDSQPKERFRFILFKRDTPIISTLVR